MRKINLNDIAVEIAKREKSKGKKVKTNEVSIGNIKEILRIVLILFSKYPAIDVLNVLKRYEKYE